MSFLSRLAANSRNSCRKASGTLKLSATKFLRLRLVEVSERFGGRGCLSFAAERWNLSHYAALRILEARLMMLWSLAALSNIVLQSSP
jgi:hypothetical protein